MTVPHRLLRHVEEAFVEGAARPPAETEASSGRLYTGIFQAAVAHALPPEEAAGFDRCLRGVTRALALARAGELEAAGRAFAGVRAELRPREVSPAARLLARAFVEPARAYLDFRRDDLRAAARRVRRASAADGRLVDVHGMEPLAAHRLQLGLNLVRIRAREGRPAEAVRLGTAFLDYLELGADALPPSLASPRAVLGRVPGPILDLYFDRFAGELAFVRAGPGGDEGALFEPLARHAAPGGCRGDGFGADAHRFFHARRLALQGQTAAFLGAAAGLLRAGRGAEPLLWYASAAEAAQVCSTLGPAGGRVAGRMVERASALEGAPRLFLDSVSPRRPRAPAAQP